MGRTSKGVRGIALAAGDDVISMSILRHVATNAEERAAYLKMRRAVAGESVGNGEQEADEEGAAPVELGADRYAALSAAEEHIITISENGFGKRTSAYEFRVTGRGGKGIAAMVVNERNGKLVASFPLEENDQIMLVTNAGQLIRVPVDGVRIAGRNTQGVIVFATAKGERVVSVDRVSEGDEDDEADSDNRQG
jgi:DNA gyrase subunit A